MQKVADAADISVLFFSAGANFWATLGHFLVLLFVAKYCSVLFKSLFATLISGFNRLILLEVAKGQIITGQIISCNRKSHKTHNS